MAGLLAVDVVFLSCWIAIDPLQAEIHTFKEMVGYRDFCTHLNVCSCNRLFNHSMCQIRVFYIDLIQEGIKVLHLDLLLPHSLMLTVFARADELCVSVNRENIRHIKRQINKQEEDACNRRIILCGRV